MYIHLDVRLKLLLLLLTNLAMFVKLSVNEHFIVASVMFLLICIFSSMKHGTIIYGIYVFFACYEIYFGHSTTFKFIDSFMLVTSLMFKTIYFPICAGIILIDGTKVSELITFLRKIKIPNSFIIVLAIVFRFFPVMIRNYKHISNSLRMRGIATTPMYYVLHPLKFMEYVFVPYVIISSNIANELSISCICRGIERAESATSIQKLEFRIVEYIFLLFLMLGVYFFLSR